MIELAIKRMIDMKLTKHDHIFDGFAHRNFNEERDGWRNEIPAAEDYPSVLAARDTVALFNELVCAKRRIWELEQELKIWKRPL